jgi:hypothetical protein
MPQDLDALACTAEVMEHDQGPLWDVRQKLDDRTHVWISEVEVHTEARPWWLWEWSRKAREGSY